MNSNSHEKWHGIALRNCACSHILGLRRQRTRVKPSERGRILLRFGSVSTGGHGADVVNHPPDLLGSFPSIVGGHAALAFQNQVGKFTIREMRQGFELPPIMEVHVDVLGQYTLA